MLPFFTAMIFASTIIAMIASVVFFVGIFVKSKAISKPETFETCNNQIKVCRISSIVFTVLFWFIASGLPTEECIVKYVNLSRLCAIIGSVWIAFALVNVIISIILSFTKREEGAMEIMKKLRKSSFVMGAVNLVIAFILKVN